MSAQQDDDKEEQESQEASTTRLRLEEMDMRHVLLLLFGVKNEQERLRLYAGRMLMASPLLGVSIGGVSAYFIAAQLGLALLPFVGIVGIGIVVGLQVAIILP